MPSLADLLRNADPNSALRRRFPNGCTVTDLPNWRADRRDTDAWQHTGQPEDYRRTQNVVNLFENPQGGRHTKTETAELRAA